MTYTNPLKTYNTEEIGPKLDIPKRIGFIDQCKGLGIMLMVYGHCTTDDFLANNNWAGGFTSWFTSFHMPLFFLLGGCLLAYKHEAFTFPRTLIKKASRLLLPGVYFSLLTILMFFLVKLLSGKDYMQYLIENIRKLLTLQFQGAMWFLTCYFFTEIIFLLLMKKKVIRLQALLIAVICFIASVWTVSIHGIPNRISRLLMAICFVSLGYWLYETVLGPIIHKQMNSRRLYDKSSIKSDGKAKQRLLLGVGGVLLLILGAVGAHYNGRVECVGVAFGKNPFLFLLDGTAGTLGFVLITIALDRRIPLLEFYGKNSLTVLCTHEFYIEAFWILNSQIFHLPLGSVDARLFALGVILLEVPTILVIDQYCPWLIGMYKWKAKISVQ